MKQKQSSGSERLYMVLLHLYPRAHHDEYGEEMLYVFSESVKDARKAHGRFGLFFLWSRMLVDISKSVISERVNLHKGDRDMNKNNKNIIMQNKVFTFITLGTLSVLMIPYIAMQFNDDINWSPYDFVIMGVLLLGLASIFVLIARKTKEKYWTIVGIMLAIVMLYIWAELAVGIFFHLGS